MGCARSGSRHDVARSAVAAVLALLVPCVVVPGAWGAARSLRIDAEGDGGPGATTGDAADPSDATGTEPVLEPFCRGVASDRFVVFCDDFDDSVDAGHRWTRIERQNHAVLELRQDESPPSPPNSLLCDQGSSHSASYLEQTQTVPLGTMTQVELSFDRDHERPDVRGHPGIAAASCRGRWLRRGLPHVQAVNELGIALETFAANGASLTSVSNDFDKLSSPIDGWERSRSW